jgi:hypothetical protein
MLVYMRNVHIERLRCSPQCPWTREAVVSGRSEHDEICGQAELRVPDKRSGFGNSERLSEAKCRAEPSNGGSGVGGCQNWEYRLHHGLSCGLTIPCSAAALAARQAWDEEGRGPSIGVVPVTEARQEFSLLPFRDEDEVDDHQGRRDRKDDGAEQKGPADQGDGRAEIQRVADVGVRTACDEDGLGGRSVDLGAEGAAQGEVVDGEAENRHADQNQKAADRPGEPCGRLEGRGKPEEAHDGDGQRAVHEHDGEENDPDGRWAPSHDVIDRA